MRYRSFTSTLSALLSCLSVLGASPAAANISAAAIDAADDLNSMQLDLDAEFNLQLFDLRRYDANDFGSQFFGSADFIANGTDASLIYLAFESVEWLDDGPRSQLETLLTTRFGNASAASVTGLTATQLQDLLFVLHKLAASRQWRTDIALAWVTANAGPYDLQTAKSLLYAIGIADTYVTDRQALFDAQWTSRLNSLTWWQSATDADVVDAAEFIATAVFLATQAQRDQITEYLTEYGIYRDDRWASYTDEEVLEIVQALEKLWLPREEIAQLIADWATQPNHLDGVSPRFLQDCIDVLKRIRNDGDLEQMNGLLNDRLVDDYLTDTTYLAVAPVDWVAWNIRVAGLAMPPQSRTEVASAYFSYLSTRSANASVDELAILGKILYNARLNDKPAYREWFTNALTTAYSVDGSTLGGHEYWGPKFTAAPLRDRDALEAYLVMLDGLSPRSMLNAGRVAAFAHRMRGGLTWRGWLTHVEDKLADPQTVGDVRAVWLYLQGYSKDIETDQWSYLAGETEVRDAIVAATGEPLKCDMVVGLLFRLNESGGAAAAAAEAAAIWPTFTNNHAQEVVKTYGWLSEAIERSQSSIDPNLSWSDALLLRVNARLALLQQEIVRTGIQQPEIDLRQASIDKLIDVQQSLTTSP